MGDGKHCPICGKEIGVWPVLVAGWPSRIWCPHFKSRLRYSKIAPVIAVLLVLPIVIAVGAFVFVSSLATRRHMFLWGAVTIISWAPVEVALTWFLRNHRELETAARSQAELYAQPRATRRST
jgi:hypothetical protein